MTAPTVIFVTRHQSTKYVTEGALRIFTIDNLPGIEVVQTVNDVMEFESESIRYLGEEFPTVDAAAEAWRAEQRRLELEDRTGEAPRRFAHGLCRPMWSTMTPAQKQPWLEAAGKFTRMLAGFNLRITSETRQ